MAAIAYPSMTGFDDGAGRRDDRRAGARRGGVARPARERGGVAPRRPAPHLAAVEPANAAVYRRRRVVALVVLALAGAMAILVVRAAAGVLGGAPLAPSAPPAAAGGIERAAAVTYVVQPGDTYWSIVAKTHPAGDMRSAVDRLVASRHGAALRAGDTVTVP